MTFVATLADGTPLPAWLVFDAATRTFSGTPPSDYNGFFDVKIAVTDAEFTATDEFKLTITPVNDAPVALPLVLTPMAEDSGPRVITVAELLASVSDVDGPQVSISSLALATGSGTLTNNGNGTWSYFPAINDDTSVLFSYVVTDGFLSASSMASLDITPINDAPEVTLGLSDLSSPEDTAFSVALPAASFVDVDSATLLYSSTLADGTALPSWLTFNAATKTFFGTPPLNFNGSVDVKVSVSDGLLSASDQFVLTITPVNDAPVAASVTLVSVVEDSGPRTITSTELLAGVFDADGPPVTITSLQIASGSGTLIDNNNGTWTYTPALNDSSSVTLSYAASDGSLTATSTAMLDITPVNDGPSVAVLLVDRSSPEDSAVNFSVPAGSFTDVDGDVLTYSATLSTGTALPSWLVFNASTQAFAGTPLSDFNGSVDVKVTASDGRSSASDVFTLTITPVNDAPTVVTLLPDITSPEDSALSFALLPGSFADVDGDVLSYSATLSSGTALPSWLSFNTATQSFSGTPPANFNGTLDVKVTASDGILTISRVFALIISPVNDAPFAVTLLSDGSSPEDTVVNFSVPTGTFSDVDGDTLTFSATLESGASMPAWLTFNVVSRTLTGTPPSNFNGSLSVKVTASDGSLTASDVFILHIIPVNDAPVATAVTLAAISEDLGVRLINSAELLAGVTDVDDPAATIANLTISAGGGNLVNNGNGTWNYTPAPNDDTAVTFNYTASDGTLTSSSTASLDITPVNDAPVAAQVTLTAIAETQASA